MLKSTKKGNQRNGICITDKILSFENNTFGAFGLSYCITSMC